MQDHRQDPEYQEKQFDFVAGSWVSANGKKAKRSESQRPIPRHDIPTLWHGVPEGQYLSDEVLNEARAERGDSLL